MPKSDKHGSSSLENSHILYFYFAWAKEIHWFKLGCVFANVQRHCSVKGAGFRWAQPAVERKPQPPGLTVLPETNIMELIHSEIQISHLRSGGNRTKKYRDIRQKQPVSKWMSTNQFFPWKLHIMQHQHPGKTGLIWAVTKILDMNVVYMRNYNTQLYRGYNKPL